jgi:type II secretory pathway pseudopilin PulG
MSEMLIALIVLLAAVVLLGLVLLRDSRRRRRELHDRRAALAAAHEARTSAVKHVRTSYHSVGAAPWPAKSIVDRVDRERRRTLDGPQSTVTSSPAFRRRR